MRRRSARRRRPLASTAGTAVAVLAVGLVVAAAPATELAAQLTASWSPFRDAGTLVDAVPQVPRVPQVPGPGSGIVDPEPQVTVPGIAVPVPRDVDLEIVPPVVPRGVIPEFEPPPATCGGYSSPRRILPGVVPGPGSATLSWMADSDNSTVRGYRVQAVSQVLTTGTQPDPPQALAGQRDDCGEVTATIGGLTRGVPYVFWLEEQVWDERAQRMRYLHVGTTDPVLIP
ncbi:hypothetical protein [Trujillonella humicola]|uniref:hypothetical protein n=1 Tax=Trujillonella humicola TaxID=3383699 RepID=UPI0039067F2A